jgi:hypothetical protein
LLDLAVELRDWIFRVGTVVRHSVRREVDHAACVFGDHRHHRRCQLATSQRPDQEDTINPVERRVQYRRVSQVTAHHFDAVREHGTGGIAGQRADITGLGEQRDDLAADIAGCPRHQDRRTGGSSLLSAGLGLRSHQRT